MKIWNHTIHFFCKGLMGVWCKVVNVPGRGLTKIKQVLTMEEGSPNFNWIITFNIMTVCPKRKDKLEPLKCQVHLFPYIYRMQHHLYCQSFRSHLITDNHFQCLYELPFWSPVDMMHNRHKIKLDLTWFPRWVVKKGAWKRLSYLL